MGAPITTNNLLRIGKNIMRTIYLAIGRRKRLFGLGFLCFATYVVLSLRRPKSIVTVVKDEDLFIPRNELSENDNIQPPNSDLERVPIVFEQDNSNGYFIGLDHTNHEKIVNPPGHKPIILIWAGQFGSTNSYLANPDVCGGDVDCEITYDRDKLDQSGAVVFHYTGANKNQMPPKRRPEQLYLWWTLEKNHGAQMHEFDNFFNLTFSYRADSGIYAPYGSTNLILRELREANELELEPLLEKKRKSGKEAVWVVSNCGVSRRNELAKHIQDGGIDVDLYGRCHGGRRIGDGAYSSSFYEALSHYKYYFAFENGYHCKDYMTEKFWFNGLRSGAVPIVLGPKKEDVASVAPKHSFIHVDDFPDVQSLVKYLKYLSSNETAYAEYLNWRTWVKNPELMEERLKPHNRDNDLRSFCKLCRILQEEEEADRKGRPRRKMVVPSMNEFWWKSENSECLNG